MARELCGGVPAVGVTYPFGQPNVDDWLHWVSVPYMGDSIAVRYRGIWYLITHGLFGYEIGKISPDKKLLSQPSLRYAELPWHFQADREEWRHKLYKAITGV